MNPVFTVCMEFPDLMKRIFAVILSIFLILGLFPAAVFAAPDWPSNISIEADGGIVMDADSGAVLFGKNLHETYYPASITKVLTALVVLENCDLNEEVTYSYDAVYNVESGSSNAGLDEGDVLTVRDSLYAMLLQSANEAANALAEHVAGSREAFAEMMNAKAAELGCQDSHFANPSGLNDENHYTSAYDMALICQAAIKNPVFLEIDGSRYYDLPPTKRYPEGSTVYAHHAMLIPSRADYYEGAFGGKTGYTSLAGNTLVTFASRNGMTLVAVVLNGHQTHYSDTKAMLDFGFSNFQTSRISDLDSRFSSLADDMSIAGLPAGDLSMLSLEEGMITLPLSASIGDADVSVNYQLEDSAPENAIAQVQYTYNDRVIGSAYLLNRIGEPEETISLPPETAAAGTEAAAGSAAAGETDASSETADPSGVSSAPDSGSQPASAESTGSEDGGLKENGGLKIPAVVWIALAVAAVIAAAAGAVIALNISRQRKEEERRRRQERRHRRLREIGVTDEEFEQMMAARRAARQESRGGKKQR